MQKQIQRIVSFLQKVSKYTITLLLIQVMMFNLSVSFTKLTIILNIRILMHLWQLISRTKLRGLERLSTLW
jgi:hypothetical protein